jgi:hypothetical protein
MHGLHLPPSDDGLAGFAAASTLLHASRGGQEVPAQDLYGGMVVGEGDAHGPDVVGGKRKQPDELGAMPAQQKADKPKSTGKCEHNREKRLCRECGGWALCEHNRRKSYCKECGGAAICVHSRQRSKCKDCGPPQKNCEHGRLKTSSCKKCREASMCQHRAKRARCNDCKPCRDLGAVGMALELHDFLSLLETEHLPHADHPCRAEIIAKMQRMRAFAFSHVNPRPLPKPNLPGEGVAKDRQAHPVLLPPPMPAMFRDHYDSCHNSMQQLLSPAPYPPPTFLGGWPASAARGDAARHAWAGASIPLVQSGAPPPPPPLHPYFPSQWPQFLPHVRHERARSRREGKPVRLRMVYCAIWLLYFQACTCVDPRRGV